MVRRIPPALGLVPLEHRKIGNPEKSVICGCTLFLEKLVTVCEFLRQRQPYLSRSFEDLPFARRHTGDAPERGLPLALSLVVRWMLAIAEATAASSSSFS